MLRNPHYKGCASFGKCRSGPKIGRPRAARNASAHQKPYSIYRTPPEDWMVVPVAAVIDEALFDAAQEKLEQNRARLRQRKRPVLVTGDWSFAEPVAMLITTLSNHRIIASIATISAIPIQKSLSNILDV